MQDLLGKDEQDRFERTLFDADKKEKQYLIYQQRSNDTGWMDEDINKRTYAAKAEWIKAGNDYWDAHDEYLKTPLGKIYILKGAIQDGKNAVANILEKAAKKLRK